MFQYPLIQHRQFLPGIFHVQPAISPANRIFIVNPDNGSNMFHTVLRLRHIVEPGIIHDRTCRPSHLGGKFFRTERIHRERRRSSHIVFQSESMSYLMGRNKTDRTRHIGIAKPVGTGTGIDRPRLHPHPGVQQSHHIMPPHDIGFDNLSGTRIDHRRSHGVGTLGSRISNHRITYIVDIEIRIILRGIFSNDRIFKAGSFKRHLPIENTCLDFLAPLSRSSRIDIKHDRFHRLDQLSLFVLFHIFGFGFQTPAVYQFPFLHRLLLIVKIDMRSGEKTYARIGKTRTHRFFG